METDTLRQLYFFLWSYCRTQLSIKKERTPALRSKEGPLQLVKIISTFHKDWISVYFISWAEKKRPYPWVLVIHFCTAVVEKKTLSCLKAIAIIRESSEGAWLLYPVAQRTERPIGFSCKYLTWNSPFPITNTTLSFCLCHFQPVGWERRTRRVLLLETLMVCCFELLLLVKTQISQICSHLHQCVTFSRTALEILGFPF